MNRTVNRERQMIAKEQCSINFEYDTLDTILATVERLIENYGRNAKIMTRQEPYSDSDREYMYLYQEVPETDEEMTVRVQKEENVVRLLEERDIADYKRLTEKYGDKK